MFAAINAFLTRAVSAGYFLNKSLRFRSSASAYLNRTFGTPTNNKKWTWSGWVKRGALSGNYYLISASDSPTNSVLAELQFNANDTLGFNVNQGGSYTFVPTTTAVFRDPAAWYHIVFVFDSAQATLALGCQLYVNGVAQTLSGTYTQNGATILNSSGAVTNIGRRAYSSTYYFDGEMAEVNFVDGQALAPTSFGAFSTYNQWLPIRYAGTYGTNGFYLPFTNTTSTSTLVADSSGNANNWTPNNISLTAGSTYDSLTDVPTLTSTTVANYPVLSPLSTYNGGGTLSNGNLTVSLPTSTNNKPTLTANTGKWYAEFTCISAGGYSGTGLAIVTSSGTSLGGPTTLLRAEYANNGQTYSYSAVGYVAYGSTWTDNDVIGVAWDCAAGQVTYYKNNVSQGTLSSPTISVTSGGDSFSFVPSNYSTGATASFSVNYGQQPWKYSLPSGFLALNTYNI